MTWYASFHIAVPNQQRPVAVLLLIILLCRKIRMCWEHQPHRHQSWNGLASKYEALLLRIKRLCPSAQRKQQMHKGLQCGPALGYIEPSFITESYSSMALLYASKGFTSFSTFAPFNDNSVLQYPVNSRCIWQRNNFQALQRKNKYLTLKTKTRKTSLYSISEE